MIEQRPRRLSLRFNALLGLCAWALSHQADAQPATAADLAKADELYRQGNVAFEAGKFEDALKLFRDAFALKKSSDIAGNLGQTERKLGLDREAAEHLSLSLRIFPVNGKEKARQITTEALAEVKKKVGCFSFQVNVAGANIRVGDRVVGPTPIEDVVCAYPGGYTIRVERDGYDTHIQELKAEVDRDTIVPITLKASAGSGAGGAGGAGGGEGGDARPSWPGWVMGGVGLASLAAGAALMGVGQANLADGEDVGTTIADQGGSCEPVAGPGSEQCADGRDALDQAATLSTAGIAMLGIGGGLLLGGVIYLVVPDANAGGVSAVTVLPWAAPQAAGLVLQGAF